MAGVENKILYSNGWKLQPSQAADINNMQHSATDISFISATGTPEGAIVANPSSMCFDVAAGNIYSKTSGTGNTGWAQLNGGSPIPVAGAAGTFLRSDGAAWVASTATIADTFAQGDLIFASAANTLIALAKDTNATRYLSNTGASNSPAWAQIALTTGVTGILPIANGGTNASSFATTNGIVKYDGTRLVTSTATLDAANISSNSAQPCFQAAVHGASLNDVTGDGTNYTVIFNNVNYDQAGNYNNATGVFTCPKAGKYLFTVTLDLENVGAAHTDSTMSIQVDATPFFFVQNPAINANPSGYYTIRGSKIIDCALNSQVTVRLSVSGGTKTIDIRADSFGEFSTFDGCLLC